MGVATTVPLGLDDAQRAELKTWGLALTAIAIIAVLVESAPKIGWLLVIITVFVLYQRYRVAGGYPGGITK